MKFVGSKRRLQKYLVPIITSCLSDVESYIEPFVGGCNLIEAIPPLVPRYAYDINPNLIALFKALQYGWIPPDTVSEDKYRRARENIYNPELTAFISICCSYSGKEWGGFARGNDNKGRPRNYALEQKKHLLKQVELIRDVHFECKDYRELDPKNSCLYLDPPYENTTEYKYKFNHEEYWDWVRHVSKSNIVFCSEYKSPSDFICIWEHVGMTSSLDRDTGSKRSVEKLFVHRDSNIDIKAA